MIKKTKEKLLSLFSHKYFPLVTIIAFLGIFFPLLFVDGLASTIGAYTASAITGTFLLIIATSSLAFSTFADWFVRVSLSSDFISIPYTTGNAFVVHGWSVVRDFVNMFFILVLIIIGLSTSLQIETYRWQKTLPRLIIVALLINFTLRIMGVFIDGSNMMMNYFVSSLADESFFIMRMRGLYDVMASNLADAPWTSFTGGVITPTAMAIIFTAFNLLTGFIYGLYGLLFAMRYVAIWLLLIISPFGFFCYILPGTQPFFRQWWRWFIGWCIAGIAAAFFLYLGEIMFQPDYISQEAMMPSSTDHQGMEIGMFIRVFPLIVPLLFTLFGFFVTVSISVSGAKGIVAGLQTASGIARKSSSQLLPGSTLGEKTQSAGAAVRNAFSPPPVTPSSSAGSSPGGPSSGKERSGSLHKRQISASQSGGRQVLQDMRRPITEATSHASQGTVEAAESIASELSSFGVDRNTALPKRDGTEPSSETLKPSSSKGTTTAQMQSGGAGSSNEKKEKKCSQCGASINAGASVCPLCRKNTLPSKE